MDPSLELAKRVTETEQRLKLLLKATQHDEKQIKAVSLSLRELYEDLIVKHNAYANRIQIDQSLWKLCFYKKIEDYRKRHGKLTLAANDSGKKDRAAEALRLLNESFSNFLEDSKNFFLSLLQKLLDICGFNLLGYSASQRCSEMAGHERNDDLTRSCYRCLICLGDLERYVQLYIKSSHNDWTIAEKHYELASLFCPQIGNPHNQLAVLATYRDDDLSAVYRYARALLCESPFITARENLELVFGKNRERCINQNQRTKTTTFQKIEVFRDNLVRLHGVLWSQCEVEEYPSMEVPLISAFSSILDQGDLDGNPLIMIVVTCIFIVHEIECKLSQYGSGSAALNACFVFALMLSLKVFCRISISARIRDGQILALGIFADWIAHNLNLLIPHEHEKLPHANELRIARQAFVENLVDFLNLVRPPPPPAQAPGLLLPEDLDLFGFTPLAPSHAALPPELADRTLVELRQGLASRADPAGAKAARLAKLARLARKLACGPRPVLLWDSQTGEYLVEGLGFPTRASPRAAGAHSQEQAPRPRPAAVGAPRLRPAAVGVVAEAARAGGGGGGSEGGEEAETGDVWDVPDDLGDEDDGEAFGDSLTFRESSAYDLTPHAARAAAAAAMAVDPGPGEEEVSDRYLELLVQQAIGHGAAATPPPGQAATAASAVGAIAVDEDETDEIIVFRPAAPLRQDPPPASSGGRAAAVAVVLEQPAVADWASDGGGVGVGVGKGRLATRNPFA